MAKTKIIEVTPHSIPYFCYTVRWYMQNSLKIEERAALQQRQTLAPQLRLGLEFLSMDFQQIRDRINQEFRDNPAVNDIENSAGEQTISEISRRNEAEELQEDPWNQDGYEDEDDMAGKYIGDCLVYISKRGTVKKIVTGMDKIIEKILE